VKVVPLARAAADVVSGYVTQMKCLAGKTPEEMERILGLRRAELARGAGVLWLGRLPDREELALRADTQCPGGQHYDGHGSYPPGLGVPQWELLCALPVGERVIVKPGQRPRITRKRDVEVHNCEIVDDFRLALGVTSHSGAANEQGVRVALRYVKG